MSRMSRESKRYAYLALAAICIMQIIWVGICWNCISLYSVSITEEWGITRSEFMVTITCTAACNTILSLFFIGRLIARLGIRKLIVIGGTLCSVAFLLFALSQNVGMLYLAGALFGLGCGMVNVNAVNAVCIDWFRENTGTYMSVASTVGSIAGIIAATAVAALIAMIGWRESLYVIVGISVVGIAVCAFLYKGSPKDLGVSPIGERQASEDDAADAAGNAGSPTYAETLRNPKFWILAAATVVMGIVGYAILANIPLIVTDSGYSEATGTVLSVALASSAICLIPFGRVLDKLGSRVMIGICFLFLVIAMVILMAGVPSLAMLYVIAALVGAAYDMCLTAPGIAIVDAFGRLDYPKKMGTLMGCCYAGVAIGPTVMNLFFDLGGGTYYVAFIVFIALSVMATAAVFPITRRTKA